MGTWLLQKQFRFEASHQLMHHDGKCANLHGHTWHGSFLVSGTVLTASGPKEGMVIDYSDLGKITKLLEDKFDHQHLNDVLGTEMPTSEFLAEAVFGIVKNHLPDGVELKMVSISETENTRCDYTE